MWNETAQIYLEAGAAPEAVEAALQHRLQDLPDLVFSNVGRNLAGSWGCGDLTVDLCFGSADARGRAEACLAQLPGVARVDRVAYRRVGGGQRAPGLRDGTWRTLMLRVREGRDPAQVAALEQDLLRMPAYILGIRNWQLSRVCPDGAGNVAGNGAGGGWTHVWQQEFASVEDLQGEYLAHPYHWGWVDRWFDPEFPEWTVDAISHAFCPFETSLLTHQTEELA
ncbi:MAG: Dabb family protein [Comamonas sp.]|jgi:hypothetical protein|nr:Dabb family protein [Comamonas sp.]